MIGNTCPLRKPGSCYRNALEWGVSEFLDYPAVQAGLAPLFVALVVAFALARTRFAWLAILASYAAMIALTTGFAFSPLTAARKTVLVGLLLPLVGVAADLLPRPSRLIAPAFAIVAAALSVWVFVSVLQQRETLDAILLGGGIALFVAALVAMMLRLANDGLRGGAAGLGLGLATGVAGVLSASVGYLIAGIAIAASAGALLIAQVVLKRKLAPRFTGALAIGVLTALFASGTLMLAELRWYALPLFLLVPAAASLPVPERAPLATRAAILAACALLGAAFPILAA
jgi:hypothetical protein